MFNILIVDDEQIERDVIKFLINKYNLPLFIMEAENGEEALQIMKTKPVDILLTDIKMPFMDGMELCQKARSQFPNMKIIIFSAYGEFEYAKKAISFTIFSYILKPIDVSEFLEVFSNVIELCEKELLEKKQELRMLAGYQKGIEYEKGKILLDLINGSYDFENLSKRLNFVGLNFSNQFIQIILIDFRNKFFHLDNVDFFNELKSFIPNEFEYVNLNENQSCLFIMYDEGVNYSGNCYELASDIKAGIDKLYNEIVTIVMGKPISDIEKVAKEYAEMESILENKFFFNESVVLSTYEDFAPKSISPETVNKLMENVYLHLRSKDYYGFQKGVELFFNTISTNEYYSIIYTKYICIEITKKILEITNKDALLNFKDSVEQIFNSVTLSQLKEQMDFIMKILQQEEQVENKESTKKVIKDILKIIEDNYMNDISLEWIAEKVYLSHSYLSYLFRKEMGQSLVKYITFVRMKKAEELLTNTNMKIVEISVKVGYLNHSYFCMSFKNYYGISAAKFRENNILI